jgi:G:T-mismatch repair DNA endonuclease (very short patch repair protein)
VRKLGLLGWKVEIIWECEVGDLTKATDAVTRAFERANDPND